MIELVSLDFLSGFKRQCFKTKMPPLFVLLSFRLSHQSQRSKRLFSCILGTIALFIFAMETIWSLYFVLWLMVIKNPVLVVFASNLWINSWLLRIHKGHCTILQVWSLWVLCANTATPSRWN